MTNKPSIYALIGGTIWGNRGAEAMTCAAIARMRERDPGAQFNHFSYYPQQDRDLITKVDDVCVVDGGPVSLVFLIFPFAFLNGLLRLVGLRWPKALMPQSARRLAESTALLDVQGISFDDGRLLFLPYKILSVWPAVMMGVPVFKLSQAMGPFKQTSNRLAAKLFLPMCQRVFPRGAITAAALERIGLSGDKYSYAPDVAFSFKPGDSLSVENDKHVDELVRWMEISKEEGRLIATLAPSTVVLGKMKKTDLDYVGLLATFVTELLERDANVLIFPNANRRDTQKPRNNDFFVMDLLRERLESQGVVLDNVRFVAEDINYDSILRLVEKSDILLSSRFHGMVAGLSKGVPTMVVGWSHKYAEILSLFDIEHMATDYATAVKEAPSVLDKLISSREDVKVAITQNLNRVHSESTGQFDRVFQDIR